MKKKIKRQFMIEITNSYVELSIDGLPLSRYSIFEKDFKDQIFKTIWDHSQFVGDFIIENQKELEEKPNYEEEEEENDQSN